MPSMLWTAYAALATLALLVPQTRALYFYLQVRTGSKRRDTMI